MARLMLPLLAVASVNGAAACVGMMPGSAAGEFAHPAARVHAEGLHASAHSPGSAPENAHDHASVDGATHPHAHASVDDLSHAHAHASADDLSHAHAHAGVDDTARPHVEDGFAHDHVSCPHCPTFPASGGVEPDHAACSVSDSPVAASAKVGTSSDPKPSLSPVAWLAPPAVAPPTPDRRAAAQAIPALQLRPLTIRYCVLLL